MSKIIIPDAALAQHIAILGKTRSGKSSVMRGLVEGLLDRHMPVCIVDPKGDWWGLKLARDGKHAGYPVVIFGGEHADVPINAHSGAHVAELFATGNRPCLIDLGGWMVGERTRFWIDFASTLFKLTKGLRWLVVDEVHNFAPKGKIMDPDSGKALHWTNRLASEGLGKGLAMIFASQRPQKVHNDTLTSAETLIAMRVLHPADRVAVADWVKGCGDLELGNEVLNSLAQMDRGEGWAWSPEIGFGPSRIKYHLFKTYDSFRPQTAEDAQSLQGWAQVDLEEVKAKLATVVKEAEANDPKRLRVRISDLERELKKGHVPAGLLVEADSVGYVRGHEAGVAEGFNAGRSKGRADVLEGNLLHLLKVARDKVQLANADLNEIIKGLLEIAPIVPAELQQRADTAVKHSVPFANWAKSPIPGEGVKLQRAERLILSALAQYPEGRSKVQVAILTGYAVGGGSFSNALGALRSAGRLDGDSNRMRITAAGLEALGPFEPLPTGKALLSHWLGQLGKAERKALEAVAEVYPRTLSKEQIASRAGYEAAGGSFTNALGRLRTLELIEGRREMKASEALF